MEHTPAMTVIAFGTVDLIINAGWGTYNELGNTNLAFTILYYCLFISLNFVGVPGKINK